MSTQALIRSSRASPVSICLSRAKSARLYLLFLCHCTMDQRRIFALPIEIFKEIDKTPSGVLKGMQCCTAHF
ncbi:DNA-dependent RNA polymerase beta' subunit/160 kD subunit [Giardia duodenalis]|uniref:DNA-dependent RNA polymerase beta' subunit/160 kD subunit n=1 Tax=Giardia intestinalis TaxID=5741 RepID=V6TNY3_GIAIN|nr:DNA-dependent RNA polymerase beta' subunit/160 kD subunit [Giardia intestinalis]